MEIVTHIREEGLIADLVGELNIYAMESLSEMITNWLSETSTLILNLERTESIDGSGLQFLLFVRHARSKTRNQTLFRNVPDDVNTYLARAGLDLPCEQPANAQGQDDA